MSHPPHQGPPHGPPPTAAPGYGPQPGYPPGAMPGHPYPAGPAYGPPHPPGYPSGPPRPSHTGLWVGLAVGVVALLGLAFTGFVAPGFFLSPPAPAFDLVKAEQTAEQFGDALELSDGGQRAIGFLCDPADSATTDLITQLNARKPRYVYIMTRVSDATTGTYNLAGDLSNPTQPFYPVAVVAVVQGRYCVQSFTRPPAS
ncbi:hypothetical protein [Actinokineospora iranica]|uniref:Uncharacterized protein n=1 Tax=Actinokineospora iranica TaxID=1271860 RepID=A0A1G6UYZ2_9PSEU|nr:hypothetical protein [Actinokineospora iranica]SDD46610.1 hypothetical protein SAMN05216174_111164 [Actinokineospora iranica]